MTQAETIEWKTVSLNEWTDFLNQFADLYATEPDGNSMLHKHPNGEMVGLVTGYERREDRTYRINVNYNGPKRKGFRS